MSAYLETLFSELSAAILSQWSGVQSIYQAEHIDQIPWANITPPFAAIVIPPLALDDDWGVTNDTYRADVHLIYIAETSGDSTDQRSKLETMRDYLLHTGLTSEIVLQCEVLDWSDENEPNNVFMQKNYTHRAGALHVSILVGQTQP